MLHHVSSSLKPCLRSLSRPLASTSNVVQHRSIVSSLPLKAQRNAGQSAEPEFEALEESMLSQPEGDRSENPTSYREFLEKIGVKYQYARPLHYLGDTPFPMNPSFKPPPPISNEQKEVMFRMYLAHRLENGPRRLAKRFNLSLKRVNAILRLKLLEKTFERGKDKRVLQTGFEAGMEKLLGAQTHSSVSAIKQNLVATEKWLDQALNTSPEKYDAALVDPFDPTHPSFEAPDVNESRSDVHKSDMLEEEEQRDATPSHYERLYWESVPEDGREPLLPSILQTERQKAELRKLKAEIKASKQFLVRRPPTQFIRRPKKAIFVVGRPRGRKGPVTKFVDVGGQFLNLDDRIKSLGLSRSRAMRRQKKAEEKKQLYIKQ
ncbi:eukaryotic mitochondrial regulator protein-domain-containing protein [Flammula alnicola]|nr:eukaryotic mitochondrial regulator protein-domain-containing protein [Flammula alnicola]